MESGLSAINQKHIEKPDNLYSHQILEALLNNVQDGVLLFDCEGNLLEINPAGLKIHGLQQSLKETLINRSFKYYSILNEKHQELPEGINPVERLLSNELFTDQQYFVKVFENSPEVLVSFSAVPQYNNQGELTSGILFVRSIPEYDLQAALSGDVTSVDEPLKKLGIYQKQLNEERELLQVIIDTIPVMITIYDKRFHTFIMNNAVESITGWTNEDILQMNIMELVYPDPQYRQEISDYMQSLQPGFKDIVMRTRDGRDIETSWANIEIPDGRQVGVGIDISERKRLEKELVEARKKAEKENEVQYAFIQNISHEVRTPMNSIMGFTELLQKELSRKKELEFLNAIQFNGNQLLRLIDDIIDFSQLDNRQITVQKEIFDLNKLMNQVEFQMEGMKKTYKKRHLKFKMKLPEDGVQAILNTDRLRLQQILLNLISNAIKYTEEGTVNVGYEIRKEKHDVLFFVEDTGIAGSSGGSTGYMTPTIRNSGAPALDWQYVSTWLTC